MNIVINDYLDIGVLGERPAVIVGQVTNYGHMQYVEVIAVDVDGINLIKLVEKDPELLADYAQMLKDEATDSAKGVAELVAEDFYDRADMAMSAGRY